MQSDRSESASPITQRVQSFPAADTRGKHRIQAELKRLEQELRFFEVSSFFPFKYIVSGTSLIPMML